MRTKHIILVLVMLMIGMMNLFAQKPTVDFTADKTSGCAPLVVRFTNKSQNGSAYLWDLGNGQLVQSKDAVGTYSTPGTYSVKLRVTNSFGTDTLTKPSYITVFPSPSVNFKASANIACSPASIQFTDLSTPAADIVSREWDFGDGSPVSTATNPVHTYTNLGYYNVSLKVKTRNGCEIISARNRFIRIINGVTPNFDFSRTNDCFAPVDVNFINQTSGPGTLNYQWTMGNGTTSSVKNPTTTYNTLGTYTVKLVTTSSYGCKDSISKPITFSSNNTSFTAPDSVCPGKDVTFTNNGTPVPRSAKWDFGDGTTSKELNPKKSFATPGTYTVSLTNEYSECTGVYTKTIKVTQPPTIDFTAANPLGCTAPHEVSFQDLTPGATSWLWNFGDGGTSTLKNPKHTYTKEGNFDVTLTITTAIGCPNTLTKPVFVKIAKPGTVSFTGLPAEGCLPLTVNPTAVVTTIDGIASYSWDFGTGSPVSGASPSFTYTSPSTYSVTLTIVTNGGCTQKYTFTDAVRTGTKPTVDFSTPTTEACAYDGAIFKSTATPADRWLWDFGDNSTSPDENPEHKYLDTGYMTVKLIAWNNGCPDSITKADLFHITAPVALFEPTYSCPSPLSVSFTNNSITDPTHGTTTYGWDFGNGQTSTAETPPPITYASYGTYSVTLTVKDAVCQYIKTQEIKLFKLQPDFAINKPNFCRGELFTMNVTNIDPTLVKSYAWKIGSGSSETGDESFDSSILVKGNYDVTLTITDIHDCITTVTKPGFIKIVGSDADFNVTNNGGCLNSQITLTDNSLPAGTITNWAFDYGDGKSDNFTTPPFTHIYDKVGVYDIKLTTTDNFGCIDTITKQAIATITKPAVNFGAKDTIYCPNIGLQFADSTIGSGLTYAWNFGDNATSTQQNPVHSYAAKDTSYTIKLIVTDGFGCIDSLIRQQYIRIVSPKSLFTLFDSSSICPPLETKFISQARDYDSLYWSFGDGNTSTLPSTSNFYNSFGSYTAKLYARGHGGCIDSSSAVINVYNPVTQLVFNYDPIEACNEITVTFNTTPPTGTKFKVNFGDGGIDSSQNRTVVHTYKLPNFYTPSVLLEDSLECQVSVAGNKRILVKGVYPLFDMDKDKFCDTGMVFLTDYSIGNDTIVSRQWDFGDGSTSTLKNPTNRYSAPGTYLVKQLITTKTGCTNSYQDTVRVYLTPTPVILGPGEICVNNPIQLNAATVVPDTLTNWRWTYGNGATSTASSILNRYTVAGQETVFLSASNFMGCSNDTSAMITVWPLPTITNDPEIVMPVGSSVVMPFTYSNNVSKWTWNPTTALSCIDCPVPVANPRFTTTYNVTVVDSNGCQATSSIIVRVICIDKNYFIPNTFSPNNDGHNDVFFPRGNGVDRIQSMRIFNRWGELVFDRKNFPANSQSDGWNGYIRGIPAQSDAYVYIIEVICDNGQIVPIKGNVTLIR